MAYREKLAWVTLVPMALVYIAYFSVTGPPMRPAPHAMLDMLIGFAPFSILHALLTTIGAGLVTIAARRNGETTADERDRAIARRGSSVGYIVLLVGTILVGVVMPFTEPAWRIFNAALFAIVVAEVSRQIVIVASYRRGWHG